MQQTIKLSIRELLMELTRFAPTHFKKIPHPQSANYDTDYYESWDLNKPPDSPAYGYLKISHWTPKGSAPCADVVANPPKINMIHCWAQENNIAYTTYMNSAGRDLELVVRFYV